jgi:1-acyl-sn-glycerol-3-phosphate acyltransferase
MPRRPFRVAGRFLSFLKYSAECVGDFRRQVKPFETTGRDYRLRAEWIHRNARRLCRLMNWQVETAGAPAPAHLYCSNHLSYLDIVAIGAATPVVFVSKAEVRNWPIMGTLAECGGTLFLQRERKGELLEVARQFEPVIAAGIPVVLFLEGTSSGGDDVLPFRPSLLAPAVNAGWNVAPLGLDYAVAEGSVARDVAYWGDMTFFPHFLNLLSHGSLRARVAFGAAQPAGDDRKRLARELREQVVALRHPRTGEANPRSPAHG